MSWFFGFGGGEDHRTDPPKLQKRKSRPRSLDQPGYHPEVFSPGVQKQTPTAAQKLILDGHAVGSDDDFFIARKLGGGAGSILGSSSVATTASPGGGRTGSSFRGEGEGASPAAVDDGSEFAADVRTATPGPSQKAVVEADIVVDQHSTAANKLKLSELDPGVVTNKKSLRARASGIGCPCIPRSILDCFKPGHCCDPKKKWSLREFFDIEEEVPEGTPWWDASMWKEITASQRFDLTIGVVIIINSITIGWETQASISGGDTSFLEAMEHIFLVIYLIELMLRFYSSGILECLGSTWVLFDASLVGIGILSAWIMPNMVSGTDTSTTDELAPILVLRVLRLLRLARAVRLLIAFKTLWMLVRGLLSSATTISYTMVLVFLMMYVYSVLAVEMITKNKASYADDENLVHIIDTNFKDLFTAMLCLVQFVTLDSVGDIYLPLCKREPALAIFFVSFILIVSVALMNLVTAVIVEGAIEQANQDKEVQQAYKAQQLQIMLPELKKMFELFDDDNSGEITKEEMVNGLRENKNMQKELDHLMGTVDPVALFEMLDVDGGGKISIEEFCTQIVKTVSSTRPIELERILKLTHDIPALKVTVEKLHYMVHNMHEAEGHKEQSELELHASSRLQFTGPGGNRSVASAVQSPSMMGSDHVSPGSLATSGGGGGPPPDHGNKGSRRTDQQQFHRQMSSLAEDTQRTMGDMQMQMERLQLRITGLENNSQTVIRMLDRLLKQKGSGGAAGDHVLDLGQEQGSSNVFHRSGGGAAAPIPGAGAEGEAWSVEPVPVLVEEEHSESLHDDNFQVGAKNAHLPAAGASTRLRDDAVDEFERLKEQSASSRVGPPPRPQRNIGGIQVQPDVMEIGGPEKLLLLTGD